MEKILITGGAGFIGSAIIKWLQKFNYEIFVIDNLSFGNRAFLNIDDEHFFKEDILNATAIRRIISEVTPSVVIHLAAVHFIPYCNAHPFESANINIQGTINVLDAASTLKSIKKVFFASTAAVYPIYDEAISEEFVINPLDIYGLSKLTGEHLCHEFHLKTNIPTIICRFFNAFGPNETNPHLIPEIADQINAGKRILKLGNLTPKRDFIHTYDMAEAVRKLIEKFDSGIDIFNLGRGEEYSVTEIVAHFEQAIGEKLTIEVDPLRVRKVERMHLLADISKLEKFAEWSPKVSIEEGISNLISVLNNA